MRFEVLVVRNIEIIVLHGALSDSLLEEPAGGSMDPFM
jgi:hypothetical protein